MQTKERRLKLHHQHRELELGAEHPHQQALQQSPHPHQQPWCVGPGPAAAAAGASGVPSAAGVGRAARFLDCAPLPGPAEMLGIEMARHNHQHQPPWPERGGGGEGSPMGPQGAACPCSCSGYAGVCVCQAVEHGNYFGEECGDSVSSQGASYADGDYPNAGVRTRPPNDGLLANYHAPIVQVISLVIISRAQFVGRAL